MALASLLTPSWNGAIAVCGGVFATGLIWLVLSTLTSWYRLRKFPGPPLAHASYLWIVRAMASGRMPWIMTAAQAKYGPIMRIGPRELLIYSADEVWHMSATRSNYVRAGWYSTMKLDATGHSLFSEPDTAKHDKRKALLAGGYAGRGHMDLEADVNSQVAVFVDLLRRKYISKEDGTKLCDFAKLARWFTIDVTTLSGLGEAWGDLENERDTFNYLADADAFSPVAFTISMAAPLRYLFSSNTFLRFAGPKPTDKSGIGRFLGMAKRIVESRVEELAKGSGSSNSNNGPRHENMVDTWLRNGLTPFECYMDIGLLLNAGAETTTTVIRGTFLHILAAPTIYRKLKDEIRDGIQRGRISSPVALEEAKALPYLQAVISECFRMLPPSVIGFPKRVPPGGDTICGQFVPGGTEVFLNMIDFMRNKAVFGDDADVFRPERFTECDAERKAYLYKHIDLVFGYGRWMCPGRVLAQMELNKIVVELLRRFDFQLVNPEQPWKIQGYITWMIQDFFVRVTEGSVE